MISRGFHQFSKIILVNVFLVILAGGVVRMTQSGMGCPDWPRCFGQWIPPTDESQLPANYKEIYAFKYVDTSFNVYHTWIEYINRLAGAVLGVLIFIQFLWSLRRYRRTNTKIVWLSFALLLLTGFQGWLGSKVVEANLEVAKITTHMLVALVIAALAYHIVHVTGKIKTMVTDRTLKFLTVLTILFLVIQIILGTEVREQVDHISLKENFENRGAWISQLDYLFYVHRSFSILVGAMILFLFLKYKIYPAIRNLLKTALALVITIIALGAVMNYFSIPAVIQPLHLLLSSILSTVLYAASLRVPVKN